MRVGAVFPLCILFLIIAIDSHSLRNSRTGQRGRVYADSCRDDTRSSENSWSGKSISPELWRLAKALAHCHTHRWVRVVRRSVVLRSDLSMESECLLFQ